jgi:Cys-rich protein (TIGR01571 family)
MPLLDQTGEDEWTTGLFQCLQDISGCLDSICCFPCQLGRQCAALGGEQNTMDKKWCLISLLLPCGCLCYTYNMRASVRTRFGIAGACTGDACTAIFCGSCAHCQHQRELTNRGFWPGGSCFASAPPGGLG